MQPEPLRRVLAHLRAEVRIDQRGHRRNVGGAISRRLDHDWRLERDLEAVVGHSDTPTEDDRYARFEMNDRRSIDGSGADSEKWHEYIARILVGQQSDDLVAFQRLKHRACRVAAVIDLRTALGARVGQDSVRPGVIGASGDDAERIAVYAEPARHELPVAEMPGDQHRPVTGCQGVAHILLASDSRKRIDLSLIETRQLQELGGCLPEMPKDFLRHACAGSGIELGSIHEIQVLERDATIPTEGIVEHKTHSLAQSPPDRERECAQGPHEKTHADAPCRPLYPFFEW